MFDHFLILKKLLGHFLEHMLFMETEKYPVENAYSAFLNDHSRFSNAYSQENAVYYFHVQNYHMELKLDMFSLFFTCSLLSDSTTAPVDSENTKNLQVNIFNLLVYSSIFFCLFLKSKFCYCHSITLYIHNRMIPGGTSSCSSLWIIP
mgnify:CR=1 FL=1